METSVGLLIVLFIIGYLFLKSKETKKEQRKVHIRETYGSNIAKVSKSQPKIYTPMDDQEIKDEARRIASTVKTHDDLGMLEDKIATLDNELFDYQENNNEQMTVQTIEKQRIYENARNYAFNNPYMYYYDGGFPEIDMPLSLLESAGQLITIDDYNMLDESLKSYYKLIRMGEIKTKEDAEEIASDAISLYKQEINDLIAIKRIIESDSSEEEKEKEFNKVVKNSQFLMEVFGLNKKAKSSLYRQFEDKMCNEKISKLCPLPYASILVDNGIESLEDVNALSDKELLKFNNIGPKRLAEIREYLNNVS